MHLPAGADRADGLEHIGDAQGEHARVGDCLMTDEQLLAIFDVFDEWFRRDDFEGCSFINILLETANREHPVGRASAEHLENIRSVLRSLADEAGLRSTDEFARSFHILMKGSIVQAGEGDVDAAKRAKEMARDLIEKYR